MKRWVFLADLLPDGVTTSDPEYRMLHRAALSLARDGLLGALRLPEGPKRMAVGPVSTGNRQRGSQAVSDPVARVFSPWISPNVSYVVSS